MEMAIHVVLERMSLESKLLYMNLTHSLQINIGLMYIVFVNKQDDANVLKHSCVQPSQEIGRNQAHGAFAAFDGLNHVISYRCSSKKVT